MSGGRNTGFLDGIDSEQVEISAKALVAVEREVRRRLEFAEASHNAWFVDLIRVLTSNRSSINPHLRVEILLLLAQWAYKEGRVQDGMPAAKLALNLATLAHAPSLERRAWSHIGILEFATRNLSEATVCFAHALEIANSLGDRAGKSAAVANLAATRLEAGLIDESIKLNEYVIELCIGEEHLRRLATDAHHNIALACLFLGDVDCATHHMNSAMSLLNEPNNGFVGLSRVLMEFTFTKILIRTNKLDAARERMMLASTYADKVNSPPARRHAELARALCEAAIGQTDIAFTRLAAVEADIHVTDPAFRDFLEVELLCNRFAGKEQFARHYSKKHLSNLAQYQRAYANSQIALIKHSLSKASNKELHTQLAALSILTESREEPTGEHSIRVGRIVKRLALLIGYSEKRADALEAAARLHDIGKVAIPDAVLSKRDELSSTELEIVRRHAIEGCLILTDVIGAAESGRKAKSPYLDVLRLAAEIALHHHEWWDGTGYPRGLAGEQIPESARIVALADAFDELTHVRPYKPAISIKDALDRIQAACGKQFDPQLGRRLAGAVGEFSIKAGEADELEDALPFVLANRVINRILGPLGPRTSPSKLLA